MAEVNQDPIVINIPPEDNPPPTTPTIHPDAYVAWQTPKGMVEQNESTERGIRRTFRKHRKDEVVIPPFTKEDQLKEIRAWIDELEKSPVPLQITTKSEGFNENLYMVINKRTARPNEQNYQHFTGFAREILSIVVYAEGTGIIFPEGQYGVIGHRDLALCEDLHGAKFIYTDHKTSVADYLPQTDAGWTIDPRSLQRFANQPFAIERDKPFGEGHFDPYDIGIGSLMQAAAVGWSMRHEIPNIRTFALTSDGTRMWDKFGLKDSGNDGFRHFDESIAIPKVIDCLYTHIR